MAILILLAVGVGVAASGSAEIVGADLISGTVIVGDAFDAGPTAHRLAVLVSRAVGILFTTRDAGRFGANLAPLAM